MSRNQFHDDSEGPPTLTSIHTQLVRMNGNLENHVRLTEERINNHRKTLDEHSRELYGANGTPGMKMTLDRLAQTEATRKGWIATLGTVTIGLAMNAVWDKLKGR